MGRSCLPAADTDRAASPFAERSDVNVESETRNESGAAQTASAQLTTRRPGIMKIKVWLRITGPEQSSPRASPFGKNFPGRALTLLTRCSSRPLASTRSKREEQRRRWVGSHPGAGGGSPSDPSSRGADLLPRRRDDDAVGAVSRGRSETCRSQPRSKACHDHFRQSRGIGIG